MTPDLQKTLLETSRKVILEKFIGKKLINKEALIKEYPALAEPGAVFVTLNKANQLRGCIGSIQAYRSLLDDVIGNAALAAFNDPRFDSLQADELDDISLEISILSKPRKIDYNSINELKTKIKPFIDGVVLSKGYHRAVFLPQVWEQLPNFDIFFEHLCKKAGLSGNCLSNFPVIEIFNVTIIQEP